MSEKTVVAAVTPQEWAKGEFLRRPGGARGQLNADGSVGLGSEFEGANFSGRDALAAAAFCLHGRITWQMVDHLRANANQDGATSDDGVWVPNEYTTEIADLLESLLPPREQ